MADDSPLRAVLLLVAPRDMRGALFWPVSSVFDSAVRDSASRHALLEVEGPADLERLVSRTIRPRVLEVLAQ